MVVLARSNVALELESSLEDMTRVRCATSGDYCVYIGLTLYVSHPESWFIIETWTCIGQLYSLGCSTSGL